MKADWFSAWKGKKILITGHTGFKGSWMCTVLAHAGAQITGYALEAEKESLFQLCHLDNQIDSVVGDIRDLKHVKEVFDRVQPEIVIHMAAQPLVRTAYKEPVYTYETNVMGTVNVLECIRLTDSVKSFVNVTTDKVYLNREWEWGYRENEELNGQDPYSNSKSCSELVTDSYKKSFFTNRDIAISTMRAGNVIGGGDFAKDRIIPDCVRAAKNKENIKVRNPFSVRPYQHVLEPVMAYLLVAIEQYENKEKAGSYNIGPEEKDCIATGELVNIFCREWTEQSGNQIEWIDCYDGGPHEATFLKLDCAKFKSAFGWRPVWSVEQAVSHSVNWYLKYTTDQKLVACMDEQINEYMEGMKRYV